MLYCIGAFNTNIKITKLYFNIHVEGEGGVDEYACLCYMYVVSKQQDLPGHSYFNPDECIHSMNMLWVVCTEKGKMKMHSLHNSLTTRFDLLRLTRLELIRCLYLLCPCILLNLLIWLSLQILVTVSILKVSFLLFPQPCTRL